MQFLCIELITSSPSLSPSPLLPSHVCVLFFFFFFVKWREEKNKLHKLKIKCSCSAAHIFTSTHSFSLFFCIFFFYVHIRHTSQRSVVQFFSEKNEKKNSIALNEVNQRTNTFLSPVDIIPFQQQKRHLEKKTLFCSRIWVLKLYIKKDDKKVFIYFIRSFSSSLSSFKRFFWVSIYFIFFLLKLYSLCMYMLLCTTELMYSVVYFVQIFVARSCCT